MSMIERIKHLEVIARQLEPISEERNKLRNKVIQYSESFLDNLEDSKAFLQTEDKGIKVYDSPISEEPADLDELLGILKENVDKPGLNPASGGHLAYIPGGGIFPASLGDYIAAITNHYAGVFYPSPGAVRIENLLIKWMCEIIGYPETAFGNLTSGGSIANLIGIVTARDAHKLKAKDFHKVVIYTTEQVHHSVTKSIRIAGLGEAVIRDVQMDERFRMKTDILENAILKDKQNGLTPWLIIASAGTTDTGSIDPIDEIAEIAKKNNLWLHCDAAYGGFFVLCDEVNNSLKGLNKCDSIVIDPHKGLFLPYGSGTILVKDRTSLSKAHYYKANYLQEAVKVVDDLSPSDYSPELTKHFRGLRLWLPLKLFGLKPFRAALEEKIMLARYFYEKIQEIEGFEVGPYPELSVVIYRYIPPKGDPNEFNEKLIEEIINDGRVFLSSTMIDSKFYLRLAVLSFRSHLKIVNLALEVIKEKVKYLEAL
ncbi:MAG: amino acid decarboxylase [Bacteroidetes bacterium]|nr:MAG: amino acid decarboxylase [Bacteroidota bacterium]